MKDFDVTVRESGNGPYGQFITAGHHVLGADEPETQGGSDTGPDPYRILLAALGACTAMTMRMYATRHEWPLEHIEVRLRRVQRAGGTGGLQDRFERVIDLKGALDADQRARLLEIADKCPVSQTLQHPSEIVTSLAEES